MMALSSPVPAQGLATTPLRHHLTSKFSGFQSRLRSQGKLQLVYEPTLPILHVSTWRYGASSLLDSASGSILGDFRESELQGLIGRIDHSAGAMEKLVIPSVCARCVLGAADPILRCRRACADA